MPPDAAPTDPAVPDPALPDDWADCWAHCVRRRRGDAAADAPRSSDASRALAALYEPMLAAAADATAPPWLLAQLGQSLDGHVATQSGDSYYVTGAASLLHLHRLRALSDVVLVGAGTVAADDPRLTTRRVPGAQPVRAVLDPGARLDGRAGVFRDGLAPTLWLCDAHRAADARARLADGPAPAGVEVVAVPGLLRDAALDLRPVVAALAARGLRCIFVEGGGVTVSRFLEAGLLDRLHLVIAPVLIGQGRRGLSLAPRARMADCLRPPARVLTLGDDVLWDLDLRAAAGTPAAPLSR